MSNMDDFIEKMMKQSQEAIDSTIKTLCDSYAKNEEDCEEVRRAIMGVVHIGESIGHLKAMHQEITFNREAKRVKKE